METAILCKIGTKNRSKKVAGDRRRNQRFQQNPQTKHACIVEAHEPTRKRLESIQPKDHEDHIAQNGFNSASHYNLVRKFLPMPQAMKISVCESSSV